MSRLKSTSLPAKKSRYAGKCSIPLSMQKSLEVVSALDIKLFYSTSLVGRAQAQTVLCPGISWDQDIQDIQYEKSGLVLFFGLLTCCQSV